MRKSTSFRIDLRICTKKREQILGLKESHIELHLHITCPIPFHITRRVCVPVQMKKRQGNITKASHTVNTVTQPQVKLPLATEAKRSGRL